MDYREHPDNRKLPGKEISLLKHPKAKSLLQGLKALEDKKTFTSGVPTGMALSYGEAPPIFKQHSRFFDFPQKVEQKSSLMRALKQYNSERPDERIHRQLFDREMEVAGPIQKKVLQKSILDYMNRKRGAKMFKGYNFSGDVGGFIDKQLKTDNSLMGLSGRRKDEIKKQFMGM